jgi:hypothetical protein
MNLKKTIVFLLLFLLLGTSVWQFALSPKGVTWFANIICVSVAAVSIRLSHQPEMDNAFFSILVLALCVVSFAIAWGQWFVLGVGTINATLVPLITGIIWRFRPKPLSKSSKSS